MTGKANSQAQHLKNTKRNNIITERGICWFTINASGEKQYQGRNIIQVKTIFVQVVKNCRGKGLDWKLEDGFQEINQCSSGRVFQKVFAR